MNLLSDRWIPVAERGNEKITLKELLCSEERFHLSLPRDDLEMAALQLLVSLVQVLWMPKDGEALKQRVNTLLTEEMYEAGAAEKGEWFDLNHPVFPFMQHRDIPGDKLASMQALFAGMPDGKSSTSHAHFVQAAEIDRACPACAVLAIFNRATAAPNFSGKHKGPLRGGAPITTLLQGDDLRTTLWMNVLTQDYLDQHLHLSDTADNQPVWVHPVKQAAEIPAHQIGLLRGLFWQPIHISLHQWEQGQCDLCGAEGEVHGDYLRAADFKYSVTGLWPHPHSPRVWDIKKGERDRDRFLSFTTTAPSWTRLSEMLLEQVGKKSGMERAAVVAQYEEVYRGVALFLAVGGYRNKQASVLQRRHETFSLKQGWQQNKSVIQKVVNSGLEVKSILRKKAYGLGKATGVSGMAAESERLFYIKTERLILQTLRQMDWREIKQVLRQLMKALITVAEAVFEEVVRPYRHDVRVIPVLVKSRRGLRRELNKLVEEK